MPFVTFSKGMTISASDFNGNFEYIAQGNLLPRGGSSLATTNSVYDLGSQSYKWNEIHVNNIFCNSITSSNPAWVLIQTINATSTNGTLDIGGLNGDNSDYKLVYYFIGHNTSGAYWPVELLWNGSAVYGAYYQAKTMVNTGTALYYYQADGAITTGVFELVGNTMQVVATKTCFGYAHIFCRTGLQRSIKIHNTIVQSGVNSVLSLTEREGWWTNMTTTITSFSIYVTSLTSLSRIEVWERKY